MRDRLLTASLMLAVFLLSGLAVSQTVQQNRTLVVNGQSGQVAVMQINGRSFVDLEALAQLANGSLDLGQSDPVDPARFRREQFDNGAFDPPACRFRIL
jgi:hypothetical protein